MHDVWDLYITQTDGSEFHHTTGAVVIGQVNQCMDEGRDITFSENANGFYMTWRFPARSIRRVLTAAHINQSRRDATEGD